MVKALRETARNLITDGTVDLFIGYSRSPSGDVVPCFIRRAEEAETLEWNQSCTYNLARYLTDREVVSREQGRGSAAPEETAQAAKQPGAKRSAAAHAANQPGAKQSGAAHAANLLGAKQSAAAHAANLPAAGQPLPKVAVMLKGCDLKSVKVLLSESQVRRDRLYLVGLTCAGVADQSGRMLAKCQTCPPSIYNPTEDFCDRIIGDPVKRTTAEDTFEDVAEIDALSPAERRELWDRTLARCLRCYACRNICPLCYCAECVFDQHNPRWVSPAASIAANRAFHLIRAYHLAGRCVDCGECERSCPVGIPLRSINRKLAHLVKESFDFRAGLDPADKAPIVSFAAEDPEEFIE